MSYLENIKKHILDKKICFYPMGIAAKATMHKLEKYGIKPDFFSDKNSELWGSEYEGIDCISLQELSCKKQEELVVIVESLYYAEIKRDLQEFGIKNILRIYPELLVAEEFLVHNEKSEVLQRIEKVLEICEDDKSKKIYKYLTDAWWKNDLQDDYFQKVYSQNQYFDREIVDFSDKELFVDVGAYTGDTAEKFLISTNHSFEKMYLFELDQEIFSKLQNNVKKYSSDKIICYPYGLGKENGIVEYYSGDSNSSITDDRGEKNIIGEIRKLDDILKEQKVTFIKMDIEGAETDALIGAQKIIKSQKPKLAICIYHSPEDMLNIPCLIKKMVPDYKVYIRHYTDMMLETVCYAII